MDYLETIDEYIKDENRIVTYRWLSLTLNVSSNKAKEMLYDYYEKQKKSPESKLGVTYLVSGEICREENEPSTIKATVVQEEELEKAKKQFSNIFSIHIYSLQKNCLKDLNILYSVDYDIIKNKIHESAKQSSIICPSASFRTRDVKVEPVKKSSPVKQKLNENIKSDKGLSISDNKENHSQDKKRTISSMFANQQKANKSETKSNSKKSKPSPVFPSTKSNPLSNFIVKGQKPQSENLKKSPKKEESPNISPKKELISPKKQDNLNAKSSPAKQATTSTICNGRSSKTIKNEHEHIEEKDSGFTRRTSPRKREESTTNSTYPKKTQIKDEVKPVAKRSKNTKKSISTKKSTNGKKKEEAERKRIVQPFDSSSESNNEEDDELCLDECPFPLTPKRTSSAVASSDEEEVIPPTPTSEVSSQLTENSSGRRKRRKLVDKTFQDEDGFFVTKKEYEMVSESDEEDPIKSIMKDKKSPSKSDKNRETKPPPSSSGQKIDKKLSPAKTKQSSIMNFFKKK